jgi:hypothetical protein
MLTPFALTPPVIAKLERIDRSCADAETRGVTQ